MNYGIESPKNSYLDTDLDTEIEEGWGTRGVWGSAGVTGASRHVTQTLPCAKTLCGIILIKLIQWVVVWPATYSLQMDIRIYCFMLIPFCHWLCF